MRLPKDVAFPKGVKEVSVLREGSRRIIGTHEPQIAGHARSMGRSLSPAVSANSAVSPDFVVTIGIRRPYRNLIDGPPGYTRRTMQRPPEKRGPFFIWRIPWPSR